MKTDEHTRWVGAIVTNLQALETVLRYFLATLRNEVVEFPKPGDQTAKFSYLTRHTSLGKLIRTFNEALAEAEKKFEVDIGVVHIRDAITHGRQAQAPQPDHNVHDGAYYRGSRSSSAGEARVSRVALAGLRASQRPQRSNGNGRSLALF